MILDFFPLVAVGFVHGGERAREKDGDRRGRKRQKLESGEILFWLYI